MRRPTLIWLVTWGPAIAGTAAIAVFGRGSAFPPAAVLLAVTVLAAAADHIHIPIPSGGYQPFGPAVSLPAIVLLGPIPAAWATAAGAIISDGVLRRRPTTTMLFNVGQRALAILLAGLVWDALLQGFPSGRPSLIAPQETILTAVVALLAVYAVATTVQVAAFLSVFRQEPFWTVLASGARWQLPTTVILGGFGLSVSVLFSEIRTQTVGQIGYLLTALLLTSTIALLYTARRQQARELTNLHSATTDLLQSLDLGEVLDLLADKVMEIANPDMLWITLQRPDGGYEVALARTPAAERGTLTPSPDELEWGVLGWVLANRRSQRIPDYHQDPRRTPNSAVLHPDQARAVLMAPLLAGIEPVGAITLTKAIPDYFTEYQERVVSTLAAQAAVVVRNAQLYETSQRTLAHFEALKAISERINSQQDLRAAFDLIATSADEILKADRCALYLGEVGKEITHTFTRGLPAEHLRAAVARLQGGVGLLSLAMRQKEPMVTSDALADPRVSREMAAGAGYRTVAGFPLRYGDAIIGVLALYHNEVRPYGASETALGMAFANQAAMAVQNTRLLGETERRAHQLGLLNRIFTRVATSMNPHDLFDVLVEELHSTLGYPLVIILRVDGDQLRHVAHRGYAGIQETSPIAAGIVGQVARTGQAAFVTDVSSNPDYVAWDPRVTQEVCVPIVHQGRAVGVVNVEVIEPTLTRDDLNLLITLAGYAAVALEKAQLYEQTQALATTDGLTGLLNYRAFWQALERELERSMRYGLPLSLIMIEIDKFKRFNDTYGHLRGDEVIRAVARVLKHEHRAQIDIVARYGGDEFMILLPHTQKVTAAEIAERIRRAVEATPLISAVEVASVTLSLGVACYPEDGKSADTLVEAVDRSMYKAKQQGGNAVAVAKTS